MDKPFRSVYADQMKHFVETKRRFGFKYVTASVYLSHIDKLAEELGEISVGITREFAQKCCERRKCESALNRYTRASILIQFSCFLRDLGIPTFIPNLPACPKSTFLPYIYSGTEMEMIFKISCELRTTKSNPNTCLLCIPTLIRLLYSTGLRISEATALKLEDVNLNDQYLRVKDSKNGKERIIPIPASLVSVCKEYLWYRKRLPGPAKKADHFFVTLNGNPIGQSVGKWFKQILIRAGIVNNAGRRPRIHDLRHTFAVTSLASMADAGMDLYVSLPILSCYLGHQSLKATEHYVRLTANMFPELTKDLNTVCLDVFPKFKNYETN